MIDTGFQFVPLIKPVTEEYALIGMFTRPYLSLPYVMPRLYFEINVFSKVISSE